jgi:hypothetical protein
VLSSYTNTVPVVHLSHAPTNCQLISCVGRLRKSSATMSAVSQNTTVISSRNKTLHYFQDHHKEARQ